MKEITKEWLKSLNPCIGGFKWWCRCGERDPIKFLEVGFEGDHWNYRCWLMIRLLSNKNQVKIAIYSAKLVLPIFEERYPNDDRPRKAIDAAYAAAADAAAYAAAADVAADAAYADAAASAARAAASAAYAAYAAYAAAYAADAANYAADYAADYDNKKIIKQILEYAIELLKEQ